MNVRNMMPTNRCRQTGASLLVALVMLLIMTMLGLSSMKTAVMELKMSASLQQQGLAMHRAEEMIIVAEQDLTGMVAAAGSFDFSAANDGYYTVDGNVDAAEDNLDIRGDWSGISKVQPDANENTFYVIEYIGYEPKGGSQKEGDVIAGAGVYAYRITTRSETGKNAVRVLQSMFVSSDAP